MKMNANESRVISKMSHELVESLWGVLCDILQYQKPEIKLAGAKIFKKLLLGSECIDSNQMAQFETYLKEVCTSMGYDKDNYTKSSIFESCISLRKIFMAEPEYLTHYAKGNAIRGVEFTIPSQQQVYEHLDPKIKSVIAGLDAIIQSNKVETLKARGAEVIRISFK